MRWGSLRWKIITWSFVPTAIILAAVALVGFFAYEQVTENLAIGTSRELARLTAGELAGELTQYGDLLSAVAHSADLQDPNPGTRQAGLNKASNRLAIFDAGALVLSTEGVIVATEPERRDWLALDWSAQPFYRQMVRAPSLVFSQITPNAQHNISAIVVAVPIIGQQGEFLGALVGLFRMDPDSTSPFYGSIVQLHLDPAVTAYLVDYSGTVLYHTDPNRIGDDFSAQPVTALVAADKSGALRTRDVSGRDILASYAPVPGTFWGLVVEQNWGTLLAPSQTYGAFLLLLLGLGLIIPAIVVTIGVRKITQPIGQLIAGSEQVAAGKFGYKLAVRTGDELEELAQQFNHMSDQLAESYAAIQEREEHFKQRVAERTHELGALYAISAVVNRSLDPKEITRNALDKITEMMDMEFGVAYYFQEGEDNTLEHGYLRVLTWHGVSEEFAHSTDGQPARESAAGAAARAGKPLVWRVAEMPVSDARKQTLSRNHIEQAVAIPLLSQGRCLGSLNLGTPRVRELTPEQLVLLGTIGQQVGVAMENARLYQQAEQSAAFAERNRLARELHDSVTQSLYSVTLYAEAAMRTLSTGHNATTAEHLRDLRDTAQEALREMRLLIFELRPPALEKSGLVGALQARLDAVESRGGIQAELCVDGEENLPLPVQAELYSIALEALNNALKHANAHRVQVHLHFSPRTADLEICDDGIGFEPEIARLGGGFGISGMQERAQHIDAALQVSSEPGQGTTVSVQVPL